MLFKVVLPRTIIIIVFIFTTITTHARSVGMLRPFNEPRLFSGNRAAAMDVNGVFDCIDIPELSSLIVPSVRPTSRKIGAGSVEEVEIPGAVCAAKKIHSEILDTGTPEDVEALVSRFVSECKLLSTLRHPHVVQFLGVCYLCGAKLPSLVMEHLETNLHELLKINRDLSLATKQWILLNVSRGLLYLHSQSPPIVHQYLTPRNILLDSALRAKTSDVCVAHIVNYRLSRKN